MTPAPPELSADTDGSPSTNASIRRRRTNGLAIASLVLGILPIFTGVLSIVFGVVALGQIRKSGQRGRSLVIAGFSSTCIWLLAAAIAIWVGAIPIPDRASSQSITSPDRDASGTIIGTGHVSATSLRAGDCLKEVKTSGVIYDVPVVPCAQPHRGEVLGQFELIGSTYPGEDGIVMQADERCEQLLSGYTSRPDEVAEFFYIYPLALDWSAGERMVTCIAVTVDPLAGTLRR